MNTTFAPLSQADFAPVLQSGSRPYFLQLIAEIKSRPSDSSLPPCEGGVQIEWNTGDCAYATAINYGLRHGDEENRIRFLKKVLGARFFLEREDLACVFGEGSRPVQFKTLETVSAHGVARPRIHLLVEGHALPILSVYLNDDDEMSEWIGHIQEALGIV